jgi:hypothetical protein
MVRTQVSFSEEQRHVARQAARREGISMAAFLRHLVEQEIVSRATKPVHSKDAIRAFVGLGRSGRSDISEHHDETLA